MEIKTLLIIIVALLALGASITQIVVGYDSPVLTLTLWVALLLKTLESKIK